MTFTTTLTQQLINMGSTTAAIATTFTRTGLPPATTTLAVAAAPTAAPAPARGSTHPNKRSISRLIGLRYDHLARGLEI